MQSGVLKANRSRTLQNELNEILLQEGTELLQGKYNHFLKLEQSYKWVREAVQCENERLTALLASIESWLGKPKLFYTGTKSDKYREHKKAIKAEITLRPQLLSGKTQPASK